MHQLVFLGNKTFSDEARAAAIAARRANAKGPRSIETARVSSTEKKLKVANGLLALAERNITYYKEKVKSTPETVERGYSRSDYQRYLDLVLMASEDYKGTISKLEEKVKMSTSVRYASNMEKQKPQGYRDRAAKRGDLIDSKQRNYGGDR